MDKVYQMKLKQFLKKYPMYIILFPHEVLNDDNYYIRFTKDFETIEFGYLSDYWELKI